MIVDEWKGMYPSAWKGIITPESFSHPAKFSSRLIERIYQHGIECGWLHEGSRIVDCFGGVGLGAWPALRYGMDWSGVELESRFVTLAQANIDAWNARYSGRLARWGTARIIQGDSRHLAQVIGAAVIPQDFWDQVDKTDTCWNWTGIDNGNGYGQFRINGKKLLVHRLSWEWHYGPIPDKLLVCHKCDNRKCVRPDHLFLGTTADNWHDCLAKGRTWMQTNPEKQPRGENHGRCKLSDQEVDEIREKYANGYSSYHSLAEEYGVTKTHIGAIVRGEYRIGNLPPGNVEAVISSPPYAEAINTHGEGPNSIGERHAAPGPNEQAVKSVGMAYGQTPGQLASLPPGPFEAAISSPPFEDTNACNDPKYLSDRLTAGGPLHADYGSSSGQLGNDSGDTFWSAAREIVAQVYAVLAPGAHAIWVVKSYVKNKQLVDFPHQWQTLGESIGFVTLHEHHALLIRHGATSIDIDGNHHEHKTESKSFFRRLAEKNGSPRIDFETVLCMVKPGGEGGGWDGAISSPPYAESMEKAGGIDPSKSVYIGGPHSQMNNSDTRYGSSVGQLGALPPDSLDDATRHGG